jgi:hypothetical protein
LTRHSHYVRVRLGRVTIWRLQCTRCKAVFTILPHFVLRYRQMRPAVAREALLATHGGLSLELCAVICHISPMALYRLVCAFGHQSLVAVLTRCGLPLPTYFLQEYADPVSRGTSRLLPAPRAHQAPWQTHGHRVACTHDATRKVSHLVAPESSAQGLAGVCTGSEVTPLCRPRHHHGGDGQWRAGAALVSGEESGLVCGPCRPPDAGDQHALRSSA